jgi:hypothetical protein
MPLLIDTGILYALADADDEWHERSRDYVVGSREVLLAPITVLPEVTYLLHGRLGFLAEHRFVESIVAGELTVEGLREQDYRRASQLLKQYPEVGFVDASVVAIAERLRVRIIATTDRRDFSRIRPSHISSFELVP